MIEDVWEVLQSQFEKTQGLNIPLDGSSLEQSSQITHIQYYQNGNGKENFASQGNGNHKPTQFITDGEHSGNGQNGSTSSNGNKTVMDINGRMIFIFLFFEFLQFDTYIKIFLNTLYHMQISYLYIICIYYVHILFAHFLLFHNLKYHEIYIYILMNFPLRSKSNIS